MASGSWAGSRDETALTPAAGAAREWGGPGLPAAGAVARAASLPTGLPPPTRVRLPRQQPEGRLLHQWQHHRQVPVLR